jgi:hypothetical protein
MQNKTNQVNFRAVVANNWVTGCPHLVCKPACSRPDPTDPIAACRIAVDKHGMKGLAKQFGTNSYDEIVEIVGRLEDVLLVSHGFARLVQAPFGSWGPGS